MRIIHLSDVHVWRYSFNPLRLANKRAIGMLELVTRRAKKFRLERLKDVVDRVLGLNADASVRRNKGPSRPIIPERDRAEVLAALASVDAVVIFDEDTPAEIVAALQPDILVKGADWPADQIVGRDTVEARGGRVVLVPVEQGYSTTSIVERVRTAQQSG